MSRELMDLVLPRLAQRLNRQLRRYRAGEIDDDQFSQRFENLLQQQYSWLANQGVPIRIRYNPWWFPEINHWKAAIFAGQNIVEFGSGNFAPTELAPFSSTNYDDESEMFTDDPALVNAFKTKFDQMWNARHARTTPGTPEIEQDVIGLAIRECDWLPIEVGESEIHDLLLLGVIATKLDRIPIPRRAGVGNSGRTGTGNNRKLIDVLGLLQFRSILRGRLRG